MGDFSWLHFSDLHLKPNVNFNTQMARDQLLVCLKEEIKKCDYIFITGDIADKGDYGTALDWLPMVFEAVRVPPERVFWAPGNHDISRNSTTRTGKIHEIRGSADKSAEFCNVMNNADDRELLTHVGISAFKRKHANFLGRPFVTPLMGETHMYHELENLDLVVLNTCLTSCDNQDEGCLMINENSLSDVLHRVKGDKPVFVMGHHGKDSFEASERQMLGKLLSDAPIDFYLCGHAHFLGYDVFVSGHRDVIQFTCGGGNEDSFSKFSFLLGQYTEADKSVRIVPYSYSGTGTREWATDYSLHSRMQMKSSFPIQRLLPAEKQSKGLPTDEELLEAKHLLQKHFEYAVWFIEAPEELSVCEKQMFVSVCHSPIETTFYEYVIGKIKPDALYKDYVAAGSRLYYLQTQLNRKIGRVVYKTGEKDVYLLGCILGEIQRRKRSELSGFITDSETAEKFMNDIFIHFTRKQPLHHPDSVGINALVHAVKRHFEGKESINAPELFAYMSSQITDAANRKQNLQLSFYEYMQKCMIDNRLIDDESDLMQQLGLTRERSFKEELPTKNELYIICLAIGADRRQFEDMRLLVQCEAQDPNLYADSGITDRDTNIQDVLMDIEGWKKCALRNFPQVTLSKQLIEDVNAMLWQNEHPDLFGIKPSAEPSEVLSQPDEPLPQPVG